MSDEKQNLAPAELAQRLLPERLAYLLAERPIIWSESANDYDALLGEVFAELDPRGLVEVILVKDIVDYLWEARRMRALKVAALHAEIPAAAGRLMSPATIEFGGLLRAPASRHERAARSAMAGVRAEQKFLEGELVKAQITPQMLQYEAFKGSQGAMSAIEATLTRLDRRRDQLLKQLADRRGALKAMARSLIEREAAAAIDDAQVN